MSITTPNKPCLSQRFGDIMLLKLRLPQNINFNGFRIHVTKDQTNEVKIRNSVAVYGVAG